MKNFKSYALYILAPCAVFQALGMDIFVSGIPLMMDVLNINAQQIQFMLLSFMVASSVPQLIMGKISDRYGRRPIMLISTIGFCVTSYLCSVADNLFWLTVIRFFHGTSAASGLVVVYAVIRDMYEDNKSAKMYSYISCIAAITAMLAPLLGAYLIDVFHTYKSTFTFLAIFASLSMFLVYFYLPETSEPKKNSLKNKSLINMSSLNEIFKSRIFWTYTMCATMSMTGLYLYFAVGSVLLMKNLGISSYTYSLLFGVNATFYLSGNFLSSFFANKFKLSRIVMLGTFMVFIGAISMLTAYLYIGLNVIDIVTCNSMITLGSGLLMGPATSSSLAPFEKSAGTASGVFGAIQYGLPAIIGFFVTRNNINTILPLAGPLIILSVINMYLLTAKKIKNPVVIT